MTNCQSVQNPVCLVLFGDQGCVKLDFPLFLFAVIQPPYMLILQKQ